MHKPPAILSLVALLTLFTAARAQTPPPDFTATLRHTADAIPWLSIEDAVGNCQEPFGARFVIDGPKVTEYLQQLSAAGPASERLPRTPRPAPVPSPEENALRILLTDPNPKVRTLALLCAMDLPTLDLLPDIARLADDTDTTFDDPNFMFMPATVGRGRPWTPTFLHPTVGEVAHKVLDYYVARSAELQSLTGASSRPTTAAQWSALMTDIAKSRHGQTSALLMRVRIDRAAGGTTPLQPQYAKRWAAVESELYAIPAPRQFFVHLLANPERYERQSGDEYSLNLLAASVPREVRLAVVQGAVPLGDPDLPPRCGANYFLDHAESFFLPADADLFLRLEQQERVRTAGKNSSHGWADVHYLLAAAKLRPADSLNLLSDVLDLTPSPYPPLERRDVATNLILLNGPPAFPRALAWFFSEKPQPGDNGVGRDGFLGSLVPTRPDLFFPLTRLIIADPRFDSLGPQSVAALLRPIQARLGRALVPDADLRSARDETQTDAAFPPVKSWKSLLLTTLPEWSP